MDTYRGYMYYTGLDMIMSYTDCILVNIENTFTTLYLITIPRIGNKYHPLCIIYINHNGTGV